MGIFQSLPFAQKPEEMPRRSMLDHLALMDSTSMFTNWMGSPYNPDLLVTSKSLGIYDQIKIDDQARAALGFKKLAVTSAGWTIQSPQGQASDWEPAEFVQEQLECLPGTFERTLHQVLTALDYGFSITEKTYEMDGARFNLSSLKTKYPHGFDFELDEYGNLPPDGLLQGLYGGVVTSSSAKRLPVAKFLIFSHQMEFSNPYGVSDLRSAYRSWWSKDNALKWMGMLLEKYGIPPIFAMYNPNTYAGSNLPNGLQTLINSIRTGTSASVPRKEKDDLELWTPELAKQVENTFIPAIDMHDRHIARAILMPTLIGMTSDNSVGSLARSETHFDAFLMVVGNLQKELEAAIDDQVIRQLVDLNFSTDEYPKFKFNPITDDQKLEMFDTWAKLTSQNIVRRGEQDEVHIRETLKMPPPPEDGEVMEGPVTPPVLPVETDDDPKDEPPIDDEEVARQAQFIASVTAQQFEDMNPDGQAPFRQLSVFEARSDILRLFDVFDEAEAEAVGELSTVMETAQNRTLRWLRSKSEITPADVESYDHIPNLASLKGTVEDMIRGGMVDGIRTANDEIPGTKELAAKDFTPTDALEYLDAKTVTVAASTDQAVVAGVKQALLTGVAKGLSVPEVAAMVTEVFEPYVGGAGVQSAFRSEVIVRTNYNDAFNQGRLQSFQRAGDLVHGVQFSAILDGRTTEVCRGLDLKIFEMGSSELDRLAPPRHHQCRSVLVPILIDEEIPDADRITGDEATNGIKQSGKGFSHE